MRSLAPTAQKQSNSLVANKAERRSIGGSVQGRK